MELLAALEDIYRGLRDSTHLSQPATSADAVRDVKRKLRHLDRQQQAILAKAGVTDAFSLETAVEKARHDSSHRRKLTTLQQQLRRQLGNCDHSEEVQDILENHLPDEVRDRLQQLLGEQRDLKQSASRNEPNTEVTKDLPRHPELDRVRLLLSVVETRIRHLIRALQRENLTHRLLSKKRTIHADDDVAPILRAVTQGAYVGLSISSRDGVFIEGSDGNQFAIDQLAPQLMRAAWLAVQLAAARRLRLAGKKMPLILLADDLQATGMALPHMSALLADVARDGQQIVVLTHRSRLAHEWAHTGVSLLRVGLVEVGRANGHRGVMGDGREAVADRSAVSTGHAASTAPSSPAGLTVFR